MSETAMARIGDYCDVTKGKIGIKKAVAGKYPLVTTAEDRLSHNESHFEKPSVIIPVVSSTGHGHASLRRIHYQEGKFAVGTILCAVTPKDEKVLNANYLYHYLDVYKEKLLVSRMKGMANVTLPVKEIENVEFPLLSIEKQIEWVALFEKTTSYTGSLTSEITHQQTLLKKLRQSILQDAISGKLTEKWRKENPDLELATELLARIKVEKELLVKEKKIKTQKTLQPVSEDEIPFELPKGWAWCRLGDVSELITKGSSPKWQGIAYVESSDEGILFITSKNVGSYNMILDKSKTTYVQDKFNEIEPRSILKQGDLLTNIVGGSIGRTAKYDLDINANINQAVCLIRLLNNYLNAEYILNWLNSETIIKYMFEKQFAPGRANLSMNNVASFIVPLPPEKETQAIMKKIESLFSYCDQLERQITKSQQDSELLMQAVLQEAFQVEAGVM